MEVDCEEDYPEGAHTYLDIDYFTDQLLEDIGLPIEGSEESDSAHVPSYEETFWFMVQCIKD